MLVFFIILFFLVGAAIGWVANDIYNDHQTDPEFDPIGFPVAEVAITEPTYLTSSSSGTASTTWVQNEDK